MPKIGEAWINSAQKRRLETALISPVVPVAGAVALTHRLVPTIHEVPRSLYPGHTFTAKKIGDPGRDTLALRWLRRAMVDELPQILDVQKGDMTLIGPRADEPEHIDQLFEAVEDTDMRSRWEYARSRQRPGIISTYAVHSHRHNLAGVSESARYSEEEERAANARMRAVMDIADFEAASLMHDVALIKATANMAVSNYARYAQNLVPSQSQPSTTGHVH
ncbi:MAG TPA: sugar transferase [Candidatus Saccharimonadales bacterium]|nr:sugar transferase [Candidatus Saccharimonadales bacterium]